MATEPSIQDTAFRRALSMLDTVGATYAIVYNGEKHGTLELAPEPKIKRRGPGVYPRGATRSHYLPYIEHLPPGGEARIPYGAFDADVLQRNVCSYCSASWGNGGYIAKRYDGVRELSILRFKPMKGATPVDQVPA